MSVSISIDEDLRNADWVKKSNDRLSFLTEGASTLRSESRECGANAEGGGGFQPGNTCGKGDGGGGSPDSGSGGKTSSAKSVLKGSGSGRGYLEKARVETSKAIDEIHSLPSGVREVQIKKASGATTVGSYSPSEGIIKVSDKGSHPLMTTAHEFGHYIDHHVFGGGKDGKNIFGTDGEAGTDQELKSFLSACRESKAYKQIDAVRRLDSKAAPYGINGDVEKALRGWGEKNRYGAYLQRPRELWARAYAQYVAEKSSSEAMKKELRAEIDSAIRPERPSVTIPWTRHWEPDDFAPIASAIDKVLESRGLKKKT